jgi:hypothetical protein
VSARAAEIAVDVVITNYNYAAFLGDAVGSALAQTHPALRVIVVDDGSTDDSRERLGAYDGRIEVVLKENGGQPSAFNAGMERVRGDLVIFLDADDRLRPEAAARAAAAFAAEPELVKVQFRVAVVDGAGRPTGATKPPPHLEAPSGDLRRAELAFPFDLPWLPTSGNAFAAAALRRIFPIPERPGADLYPIYLTPLLGPVAALEEVGAEYRVHGRNAYEPEEPRLDLGHIRQVIEYTRHTTEALEELADDLELERPEPILSQSDLAHRLISLRLEPELHPVAGDTVSGLAADAFRAAHRRFDVSPMMKVVFVAWFLATAAAPRPLSRWLAELFRFPERRRPLNRLLGRLQRATS